MRIAYLCADLGIPLYGSKGASIHVRELVRAFRLLGHDVLVLTPRAEGERPSDFDADVTPIAAAPADAPEARAVLYQRTVRSRGLELLRGFRPGVIYERYSLFGDAGSALARSLGVPLVLEVNAPLTDEQAQHRGLADRELARRIERDVLLGADRVVAVSRALERWLVELGVDPRRISVLPNGVDAGRFDVPDHKRAVVRATLGTPDEPLVGFLGSLRPWHDVAGLIEAVGSLGRGARLVVIGDGPERASLEKRAREAHVTAIFTGAVAYELVPAYVAALDVAVAPYAASADFYFSPLKVVEYLAAGVPVVAADVGDLRHCVRPGETGRLYSPGDADALAEAIAAVLDDRPHAHALAQAGRRHVRAEHSWQANARSVVDLVHGLRRAA
jgi:glycosyltransferase involved in cell wall biosynthesis